MVVCVVPRQTERLATAGISTRWELALSKLYTKLGGKNAFFL